MPDCPIKDADVEYVLTAVRGRLTILHKAAAKERDGEVLAALRAERDALIRVGVDLGLARNATREAAQ